MEIDAADKVKVNVKKIRLHLKVGDRFTGVLESASGTQLWDFYGDVPDFMPGFHSGKYVILDIDIETGHITNWKVPTKQQLESLLSGEEA